MSAQWATVPPDSAPGGFYFRITHGDRVLGEGPRQDQRSIEYAAEQSVSAASGWTTVLDHTVWVHGYDGDTGRCLMALPVPPWPEEPRGDPPARA